MGFLYTRATRARVACVAIPAIIATLGYLAAHVLAYVLTGAGGHTHSHSHVQAAGHVHVAGGGLHAIHGYQIPILIGAILALAAVISPLGLGDVGVRALVRRRCQHAVRRPAAALMLPALAMLLFIGAEVVEHHIARGVAPAPALLVIGGLAVFAVVLTVLMWGGRLVRLVARVLDGALDTGPAVRAPVTAPPPHAIHRVYGAWTHILQVTRRVPRPPPAPAPFRRDLCPRTRVG